MVRIEIISAQSTGIVHSICTIGLAMRMDKIILDGLPRNNALGTSEARLWFRVLDVASLPPRRPSLRTPTPGG